MRERRAALERRRAVGDRGQRLEVDVDQRGRVLGDVAAVGDHQRDRLADEAHLVLGEAIRHQRLLDRRIGHQQRHRLPPHAFGQVRVGDDGMHARQRQRARLVDAADVRMWMRAAQHRDLEHTRQMDVVDVARAPGEEGRILLALDARAEPLRAHQTRAPQRERGAPLPPRAKRVAGRGRGWGAPLVRSRLGPCLSQISSKRSPPTPSAFAARTRPTLPANGREGNPHEQAANSALINFPPSAPTSPA